MDKKLKQLEDILKDVNTRMKKIDVKVDGTASYDKTHKRADVCSSCSGSRADENCAAVLSLNIPREFFLTWDKYIKLCKALDRTPNSLTTELNDRVIGTSLNCQSITLNKRIETEFSRYMAKYRRMGGAKRKIEATKHTNIAIFKNELIQKEPKPESRFKFLSSSKIYIASCIQLYSYDQDSR